MAEMRISRGEEGLSVRITTDEDGTHQRWHGLNEGHVETLLRERGVEESMISIVILSLGRNQPVTVDLP
jgi:hypothetical protein